MGPMNRRNPETEKTAADAANANPATIASRVGLPLGGVDTRLHRYAADGLSLSPFRTFRSWCGREPAVRSGVVGAALSVAVWGTALVD